MGRGARCILVALAALAATGCATYHPKPIIPREVLRELQQVRLEALQPATPAPSRAGAPVLDLTDGLSADEAVAVALVPAFAPFGASAGSRGRGRRCRRHPER